MMVLPALALVLAASPEPISFEQAVSRALELNPSMESARADADRASAQVEQARAPSLPTVGLNAGYTNLAATRAFSGGSDPSPDVLTANAQVQVPLLAPNRWAQWKRSSANAEAVKAQSRDASRQVALGAARTWLSVLAQKQVVQAQQRGVETAKAHLGYATSRRQGGLGSKLDEVRASQELAVAQTQLSNALAGLERLREQLGVSVGVNVPLDVSDEVPPLANLPSEKEALDGANEVRTDVQASKERVAAADVATRYDWTDYTPLVSLVAQPGLQTPPTYIAPRWGLQAQVLLTLPLFDGGLREGQQRERRAARRQAEAQLDAVSRQANAEVRTALEQIRRADEALDATRVSADQARSALSLAESAFRAGGTTNLEVTDAERRARDAETSVALAENAARQARLDLLAASGRFP
ncbi:MAG: TolC family protein [Myxococcaceae bacterium]|nr:TolC family protein [Myxococcaceae bacterium]MCI0672574.1 TolC family protein [Myxococcaceae bacterium]